MLEFPNSIIVSQQNDYVPTIDRLNEMNFNVFDVETLDEDLDNDPDDFINSELNINIVSSVYVNSEFFKEWNTKENFSILNWNVVSVTENFKFFIDLYFLNKMPDIIALCETRLIDEIVSIYNYPDYDLHVTCRNRHGGGVLLYMRKELQSTRLNEFSFLSKDMEIVSSEFIENGSKSFIASIYRPPSGDITTFNDKIARLLEEIALLNFKYIYLVGDINVNLLNKTNASQSLVEIMVSNSLFPLCTKPTRVKDGSASLIDHFWTNDLQRHCHNHIVLDNITDHFPLLTTFSCNLNQANEKAKTIKKRSFDYRSKIQFPEQLNEVDWNDVYLKDDSDEAFNVFYTIYKRLFELSFPIKDVKLTANRKDNSKYVTSGLKKSISECKRLNRLALKWPHTYKDRHKIYKSRLKELLKEAEAKFYSDKFKANQGNSKNTWSLIGKILNKCKCKESAKIIIDKQEATPELINNYFIESICKIKESIPECNTNESHLRFLGDEVNFSMLLLPTSEEEVRKICKTIKSNSSGCDEIPPNVLRDSLDAVIKPLTYLVNLSLKCGKFPTLLKEAKVVPIHKSGDQKEVKNKRQVSILNAISMIFEKILHIRFSNYFEVNGWIDK